MDKTKQLELDIADTIIDRPKGFSIGHRHFYLYPVTLGKMCLQKRVIDNLEINTDLLQVNPYAEVLRLVEKKKEDCCLLLAYNTLQTKKDVLSNRIVAIRKNIFLREMNDEDIATLVLACITNDKVATFIQHLGIDEEIKKISEAVKVKESKNTLSFGGKSIYGTLIDVACERYKWTFDYVLWGISFANLQLLIKDKVTSFYLTDEEMNKVHTNFMPNIIDGNDKVSVMNAIQEMGWN